MGTLQKTRPRRPSASFKAQSPSGWPKRVNTPSKLAGPTASLKGHLVSIFVWSSRFFVARPGLLRGPAGQNLQIRLGLDEPQRAHEEVVERPCKDLLTQTSATASICGWRQNVGNLVSFRFPKTKMDPSKKDVNHWGCQKNRKTPKAGTLANGLPKKVRSIFEWFDQPFEARLFEANLAPGL